jgi:hypothetical protein
MEKKSMPTRPRLGQKLRATTSSTAAFLNPPLPLPPFPSVTYLQNFELDEMQRLEVCLTNSGGRWAYNMFIIAFLLCPEPLARRFRTFSSTDFSREYAFYFSTGIGTEPTRSGRQSQMTALLYNPEKRLC